jgi:hypothetical protein
VIVERLLQKIVNDAEARREERARAGAMCPCPKGGAGDRKTGD